MGCREDGSTQTATTVAGQIMVKGVGLLCFLPFVYVSWMSLLWLVSLPTGWRAVPLAVLFAATSPVTGRLASSSSTRRAVRRGPAWDAWGQPAWPGRAKGWRLPLAHRALACAALPAAWLSGLELWSPVIAIWLALAASLAALLGVETYRPVQVRGRLPCPGTAQPRAAVPARLAWPNSSSGWPW